MDDAQPNVTTLDYGNEPPRSRGRLRRVALRSLWVLVPLLLYAGTYLLAADRGFLWGGGFVVEYPGMTRIYALSPRMAGSLGRSDDLIQPITRRGGTLRQLDGSLVVAQNRAGQLWRVFALAERVELAVRRVRPVAVAYATPRPVTPPSPPPKTPAPTPALPYVGSVYGEWFVRDDALYRFVTATYAARGSGNALSQRNDVYLFEWPLAGPWTDEPRPARRVRLVDSDQDLNPQPRWLVDADHFVTWSEHGGEARLLACDAAGGASVAAKVEGLRPVRCDPLSPIAVSPRGRVLAAERDGLTVYRAADLRPVRRVADDAASAQFFAGRPDELDAHNSRCYLTDDGATLVRVVTVFKPTDDGFYNGTSLVVWDLDAGDVRDVPVPVGERADVQHVDRIDGAMWLYLTYVQDRVWAQCLFNPADGERVDLHPANGQADAVAMGWDADTGVLVDLPGFAAGPENLALDSDISSSGRRRDVVSGRRCGTPTRTGGRTCSRAGGSRSTGRRTKRAAGRHPRMPAGGG